MGKAEQPATDRFTGSAVRTILKRAHKGIMRQITLLLALAMTVAFAVTSTALADTGKSSLIANLEGTISAQASSDVQAFKLTKTEISPATLGGVLVAIKVHSSDGLNPGPVTVCAATGNSCSTLASRSNLSGSTDSYAVANLKLDTNYRIKLNSEKNTHGSYTATVRLAGDADNDGTVSFQDALKIGQAYGVTAGSSRYSLALDVDGSGRIEASDLLLAVRNYKAKVLKQLETVNPLDIPLPDNAITLTGVNTKGLNAIGSTFTFNLAGSKFSSVPEDTVVTVNGQTVNPANVQTTDSTVTVSGALKSGKNVVTLASVDEAGRGLYHQATIWTGQGQVTVRLVDEAGQDFKQATQVKLTLPEDKAVSASGDTSTGNIVFTNVPDRTILVKATAAGNISGVVGGIGNGTLTIVMHGFGTPSNVDNNDFSQGTAGWNVGSAPVQIVDHMEDAGPKPAATLKTLKAAPKTTVNSTATAQKRAEQNAALAQPKLTPKATVSPKQLSTASIVDKDLSLGTAGEGLQSISRTFATDPGVTAVQIRYRFVTSEVPGGYYGSKYNDYFNVSLRSQKGGEAVEANSMNGFSLSEFDGSGSIAWREVTLPTNKDGDTIAVNLGVANVADGLLDSQVVVDFVKEIKNKVTPSLTWNDTKGGLDLRYKVEGEKLTEATDVTVSFATGPTYEARVGSVLFTKNVPAGTEPGEYGPFHIDGSTLSGDPSGVTHLIAASSKTDYGALSDVQVGYGANANPAVVSAGMLNLVKDSLRASGQANATITSTARTAQDQARAMFNNLVNPAHTIAQNITIQHGIYAAAGDAVINVFANAANGLTRDQVVAQSAQIQASMVAEINNQGCQNVTKHCADPTKLSVVDVGASVFNGSNGPLFTAAAQANGAKVIDERSTNGCYHLELPV